MSAPRSEARLLRALGIVGLAAGIVNVTIGGGIFRLPASIAGSLGVTAPIAYVVCALAMGLIVLCFAEAGSRVSLTGGPYAYVEVAFGPFVGFLAGVLLWVVGTLAFAAVATIFVDSVAALLPALDGSLPRLLILLGTFAVLTAVNLRGVEQGARLNLVMTIAKLLPLALLVLVGVFSVRPENLAWSGAPATPDVARTSMLLIFAFMGIESALVPSGEVRDPSRTVPRAVMIAMAVVTIFYLALHLVTQGLLGGALASSDTPLADAAAVALGPWGGTLLLVGATISMLGYVSGMTLAVPRALYALSRDGFLPRALSAVHPRFHTPHVAIVVQSVVVCALALSNGFEKLAILANLSSLLLYAACCLAAWELRRRNVREGGIPFQVPAAGVVPFLALGVIAWLLTSITLQEWAICGAVLFFASLVFWATRRKRATLRSVATA